jgi:glycerophosphoryl diester phosphodiesterase
MTGEAIAASSGSSNFLGGEMAKQDPGRGNFSRRRFSKNDGIWVIAHRGFSGEAPENTLIAFQKAIEAGSDMIELDVHLSKDKEVMVIHDSTLERTTTGRGRIMDHTLHALKRLDAGRKFSPVFAGEPLPTLAEVLTLCRDRIKVNVEIKSGFSGPLTIQDLVDRVLEEVEKAGMLSDVLFSSFDPIALARIRAQKPQAHLALLFGQPWQSLEEITKGVSYSILNLSDRYLTGKKVDLLKSENFRVNVYTVDSEEEMKRWISCQVDGIITNYPDRLVRLLGKR